MAYRLSTRPSLPIYSYIGCLWSKSQSQFPTPARPHPSFCAARHPGPERNTELGHSHCTANYVIRFDHDVYFNPTSEFWDEARIASSFFTSESARSS